MSAEELTLALKTPENMDFYLENAGSREVIADIEGYSDPESLRDQFAMAALQGMLSADKAGSGEDYSDVAYKFADAMMNARE